MTDDEAEAALDVGADVAAELAAAGTRCLLTGDMGIGNTTPSAALIAALTGHRAARGDRAGTGIDDERWANKVRVVETAVSAARPGRPTPLEILAAVGGLEIAALAGFIVGGAAAASAGASSTG